MVQPLPLSPPGSILMTDSSVLARLSPQASARLATLAETVLKAGVLARSSLKRRYSSQMVSKGPRDYQTEIDRAVEAEIAGRLAEAFPDYTIHGEEQMSDRTGREGAPVIHIDPIDGTTNFAWGLPHFGMTVLIEEGGELIAGAVYDPMLDELFSAEKDGGAYLNGERLVCGEEGNVENVIVGAGLPVPGQVKSVGVDQYHAALRRLMDNTAGVRRLGSAALSTAYVAAGRLDGFFEDGLSLHDYGAAALLVREAGGIVTGFTGGPVGANGDVLAATPALHAWLVEGFAG
jgi:myo-inositol-1(or 4)-monophosphatase